MGYNGAKFEKLKDNHWIEDKTCLLDFPDDSKFLPGKFLGKWKLLKKTTIVIVFLIGLISILAVSCGAAAPQEPASDIHAGKPLEESDCDACGLTAPVEANQDFSAGKALVESKCALCHVIEITTNARYSREAWTSNVDVMIKFGMSLSDQQKADIIDYLAATFSNE